MALEIDQVIIDKAHKCKRDHACLNGADKPLCRMEEVIGNSIFFVCVEKPGSCTFQTSFGLSYMCSCPVRQEVYRKYNV